MSDKGWDPLGTSEQPQGDMLAAARKREVTNILKSYVGWYDPFAELIQNAMDSVEKRARETEEEGYQKRLWITVNLAQNQVTVTDNGVAFDEAEFRQFLTPNVSFNKGEATRGRKGVGATYLAYAFNRFQMSTKHPDHHATAEMLDARGWVDADDISNRPKAIPTSREDGEFAEVDRGASFTIGFDETTLPGDLSYVGATTARQWAAVLRIKTPLGQVCFDEEDAPPILFDMTVVDKEGTTTELSDQTAEYVYPHTVVSTSPNVKDVREEQMRRIERDLSPELPAQFRNLNALHLRWDTAEVIDNLPEQATELRALAEDYEVAAYAFFCYTTAIWDKYSDDELGLRKSLRILRGGLQLATDRMPQGELIPIPLTQNIGYQHQTHVVVHLRNAEPDLGRKGFQPELKELGERVAVSAVEILKRRRDLLKKDTGVVPIIGEQSELHDWLTEQEQRQTDNPIELERDEFFVPMSTIPMLSEPSQEQDVVALFNQLLAGGVIRGIRVMSTSTHKQYDGLFRFIMNEPLEHHAFDPDRNPLGVREPKDELTSKPYVLEYKFTVDALVGEFATGEKHDASVDLVVAWEMGQKWRSRYSVTSLLDFDCVQNRQIHGLTHVFLDDDSGDFRFHGVILSELINYLRDPHGVQARQKRDYGS